MKEEIEKMLSPFPLKLNAQLCTMDYFEYKNRVMYISFIDNQNHRMPNISKLISDKINYVGSIGYGKGYINISEDNHFITIFEKVFTVGDAPEDLSIFNTIGEFITNRKTDEKTTEYAEIYDVEISNIEDLEEVISKLIEILSGKKEPV